MALSPPCASLSLSLSSSPLFRPHSLLLHTLSICPPCVHLLQSHPISASIFNPVPTTTSRNLRCTFLCGASFSSVSNVRSACGAARASLEVGTSQIAGAMAKDSIVPGVIVGAGRVGQALEKMGGGSDVVVRRGEKVPEDSTGPIFVCTRNDVLDAVVDSTPPSRRQGEVSHISLSRPCKNVILGAVVTMLHRTLNGMIEPWLESRGLSEATQVLVYFAVAKLGEAPLDGKTDLNPEGLTAASGKWASTVAARLHSADLSCKLLDTEEFEKSMLEKLMWICAFMLVGAKHQGATVGDVEKSYRDEVLSLIKELAKAASAEKKVEFESGIEERLCAYARTVAHFPTAVKEFDWRNGWFYGISQRALERGESDPCPLHSAWLREVGVIKS